jgi:hypothetical protein
VLNLKLSDWANLAEIFASFATAKVGPYPESLNLACINSCLEDAFHPISARKCQAANPLWLLL